MVRRLPHVSASLSRLAPVAPLVFPVFLLAIAACGGAAAEVHLTPFTPEQAAVFEDGVDFVADPEALEGRWREEWSRELDQRVTWADVIAIVTVRTVRTDTDPDQRTTFRLAAEIGRQLLGEAPPELEMVTSHDARGFGTIEGNSRQILEQEFIAFLKWYETDGGSVAPHWHLSPSTDAVVGRAEYLIERRRDIPREPANQRSTTIVHSAEE